MGILEESDMFQVTNDGLYFIRTMMDFELTKDILYLILTDELWGDVFWRLKYFVIYHASSQKASQSPLLWVFLMNKLWGVSCECLRS